MGFLCDLGILARKLVNPFGHPTQVSTRVQLASTCSYLLVRLTRALWLSMLDFPFMLQVKLPVVERIQPYSNKFATGVEKQGYR